MTRVAAFLIAFAVLMVPLRATAEPAAERLTIDTASGLHALDIELVKSQADMERGLMFRRSLADDRGMLFDFGRSQMIMMWMKNTYVPLDMVFIAKDGRVTHVAENAKPMSEAIISSVEPAYSVLEIKAGVAAKIGLKAGDVVHASIFSR